MTLIVNLKTFEAFHTITLMNDDGKKIDISTGVHIGAMNGRIQDYLYSYKIDKIIVTGSKTLYEELLPVLKDKEVQWR